MSLLKEIYKEIFRVKMRCDRNFLSNNAEKRGRKKRKEEKKDNIGEILKCQFKNSDFVLRNATKKGFA